MAIAAAKLLSQRSHIDPGKLKVTELHFEVPKDYSKPNDGTIRVFARSLEKHERPIAPDLSRDERKQLPWFLYLTGGPGGGCGHPANYEFAHSALDRGYQVLFMDQRGAGLSTTISAGTLRKQGSPKQQARYLKLFRADSIVKDCEAIRQTLTKDYPEHKRKWSVLGQSFGGFCVTNYLSRFPEGLREVFTTGGLPPLIKQPDDLYRRLLQKAKARSLAYYDKYPEDIERMHAIGAHLSASKIESSPGNPITLGRMRLMGQLLGFHGGINNIHGIILRFALDLETFGELTAPSIAAFEKLMPFNHALLYSILHEPIYLQGEAANWSAERMCEANRDFAVPDNKTKPILFTAEMIFRDMFRTHSELAPTLEVAEILAKDGDWPALYDEGQLAKNEVPMYAATYVEDIYVDYDYAQETARKIKGCKQYITNSLYHNALGSRADEVMKHLWALRDDVLD